MSRAFSGPKNPMMMLMSLDLMLFSEASGESVITSVSPRSNSNKRSLINRLNTIRKSSFSYSL